MYGEWKMDKNKAIKAGSRIEKQIVPRVSVVGVKFVRYYPVKEKKRADGSVYYSSTLRINDGQKDQYFNFYGPRKSCVDVQIIRS